MVINLDGDSNQLEENQPSGGPNGGDQDQETPQQQQQGGDTDQGNVPAYSVTKTVIFPFSSRKGTPLVATKLFNPLELQLALNILTTDS